MSANPNIHSTAFIDPTAQISEGVQVGPYCIIGKNVHVGKDTILHPRVSLVENATIGENCQIFEGAIIGGPPQDHKYKNELSFVEIGDHNIIREYCTIHRATGEGNATRIGNHNMLMAYAHIGHNCLLGNHITLASYAGVSGHVVIEDYVNIGGISGVHQFCRIGKLAMIGGLSGVSQHIPPYMLVEGRPARVYDINKIGLRRAGISPKVRNELRQTYKLLYRSNLNMSQALEAIEENVEKSPELEHLLRFIYEARNDGNGRGSAGGID